MRGFSLAGLAASLLISGWVACGGRSTNTSLACPRGQSAACTSVVGCQGTQVCLGDGSGYGACECPGVAGGGFASGGASSGGAASGDASWADAGSPGNDATTGGVDAASADSAVRETGADADAASLDSALDAPDDVAVNDAGADAGGPSTWTLHYMGPSSGGNDVQTTFTRQGSGPDGVYSGDCYGTTDTATVSGAGPSYSEIPMAGCFESGGNPCIECAAGNCPSGTAVSLVLVEAGVWQGTCGYYTVTLSSGP